MTDKEEMEEEHNDQRLLNEQTKEGEEEKAFATPEFVSRHADNLKESAEYLES